ncbi:MAG: SDR family oxidoreductase [Candidatus Thermoplasmatota archaeon]|jgi:UDP-glucose 4-epimerase|nr:SDR family oxidoreductase [Candidatus Thermoplasmatota archaeon]
MRNKKIVVTGGAGFIGSNLTRTLALKNKTIVIDNLSTGKLENIDDLIEKKQIDFINGSINDIDLLQETFKGVDYVFHQAAIPSVPKSIKNPAETNHANINGTLNVLIASKNNNVKKVIYASSSSVYGDTPSLPKKEEMNPFPLSPYAISKLTGEYYCQVFTSVYKLPTITLRYFNVYGPREDPDSEYAAVIPRFIKRIIENKPPIIFGDGKQTRDFTFIDDVVKANILAAESKTIGVFNIAGGKKITINSLAKKIMKIIGKKTEIIHEKPRPGDIRHSLADISKAKKGFNYKPCFDLEYGLKETIKWFYM